ncbi:hypothetical protein HELRODRAFT_177980 [Helobdella robusta]|uniref:NR LBD domain-containing protein n=1 Tax=Helobdella robusta TaxID=6412 RepID=T1FCK3_HELRO|nr:hypothetical protein HELRODRAFT_177980 [Helobdella robusta]ESN97548.1 hypothetical protein HELRODRAFT_177980 [Helobdella robusta]
MSEASGLHDDAATAPATTVEEYDAFLSELMSTRPDLIPTTPRFASLQMGDRVSMLKRSFVDLYLLRLIFRSMASENRLMFSDSILLTSDECLSLGWNDDVIRSSLSLVDQFKKLNIDKNEFAVLYVPNLINRQQVLVAQNNLIACLQHYNNCRFRGDRNRPGRIIMRLVSIRSTSSGILKQFVKCTLEGHVQMDDLVIEMMS